MDFKTQIEIRYGSYAETTTISSEVSIPCLYNIQKVIIDKSEAAEITMGISPKKNFAIEIYLTNEFGNIFLFGSTEFIDFMDIVDSFFSANISYVFKPPIISIEKMNNSEICQIKFINHEKIYLKEKTLLKLSEMKILYFAMINELKHDTTICEKNFKQILFICKDCIKMNMSKAEIISHLLDTRNVDISMKFILDTILNFIEFCLVVAIS